jgi:hypothetical protein
MNDGYLFVAFGDMLIDDWEVCTHFTQRLRDSCSEGYILEVCCMNDGWE